MDSKRWKAGQCLEDNNNLEVNKKYTIICVKAKEDSRRPKLLVAKTTDIITHVASILD
jgi:hypothetical protein